MFTITNDQLYGNWINPAPHAAAAISPSLHVTVSIYHVFDIQIWVSKTLGGECWVSMKRYGEDRWERTTTLKGEIAKQFDEKIQSSPHTKHRDIALEYGA